MQYQSINQSIMVHLLNTSGCFSRWFPLRSKKKDSTKEEKYRGEIQVRLNFYVQNLAVSVPNLLENGGKKERSGSFRSTLSKTFGMFLLASPFFFLGKMLQIMKCVFFACSFCVTFRYNVAEPQASWIGHGYQQHEEFGLRFWFIFLALAITAQNQRKSHHGKQFYTAATVSVAEASTAGGVDAEFEYTKEHHIDKGTASLSGIPPIYIFPWPMRFSHFMAVDFSAL